MITLVAYWVKAVSRPQPAPARAAVLAATRTLAEVWLAAVEAMLTKPWDMSHAGPAMMLFDADDGSCARMAGRGTDRGAEGGT